MPVDVDVDPFDVLAVARDADAEAVKEAYRRRVKEAHPDQGGSVEEFRLVREAYEAIRSGEVDGRDASAVDGATDGPVAEPGPRRTDPAAEAGSDTEAWRRPLRTDVEYLNYEVLDDHGWGIDDAGLFEAAAGAALDETDYGRFHVEPGESLLEAAERRGFAWPFACRGGACANCAIYVVEGDLEMPVDHILPDRLMDAGFRLSCNGVPTSEELKVLFNVKHIPALQDLLLPPRPFKQAYGDD